LQQITRNKHIILQQSKALGCCKKLQQQQIAEFLQQLTTNQTSCNSQKALGNHSKKTTANC
jgi:hypothetical protein